MPLKDDLSERVSDILSQSWDFREGRTIPSDSDVALAGGAVRLDATVLYADLVQSSRLATDFHQKTAAKVIQSFLYCMSRLITEHGGEVTSFDGDRVMGVFLGDRKNSNAATCALKMNYVTLKIIQPKVTSHFASLRETGFEISHGVGIDTSAVLVVRAGQRGSNDLVWIGRAPNLSAKLSEIRVENYHSYITEDVFNRLNDDAKYGKDHRLMWEERSFRYIGELKTIYRSSWWWSP